MHKNDPANSIWTRGELQLNIRERSLAEETKFIYVASPLCKKKNVYFMKDLSDRIEREENLFSELFSNVIWISVEDSPWPFLNFPGWRFSLKT